MTQAGQRLGFGPIVFATTIIMLVPPGFGLGAAGDRTIVVDVVKFSFPSEFPTSLVGFLLQTEVLRVPIERTVAVNWGRDGIQNVSFAMGLPRSRATSPGVSLELIPGGFEYQVTFRREAGHDVSWLNFTVYYGEPEVLFGRVNYGWSVPGLGDLGVPVSTIVRFEFPPGTKMRYSSQQPSAVEGNAYIFFNAYDGFLYIESPATKVATLWLLGAIYVGLILAMFVGLLGPFRERTKSFVLGLVSRTGSRFKRRHVLVAFFVLVVLTLATSFIFGPSPRVNVATAAASSNISDLSGGGVSVLQGIGNLRVLEFMLDMGVLDAIVVDDYVFAEEKARWVRLLRNAEMAGVPILVTDRAQNWNPDIFVDMDIMTFQSGDEGLLFLSERFSLLMGEKARRNHLGLDWDGFLPAAVVVVVFSLLTIAMAAASALFLAVWFKARMPTVQTWLGFCILVFFAFFFVCVLLYIAAGYMLEMPLGWHGPGGRAVTAISLLSTRLGGGNFPRAFAALGGMALGILVLVARRRAAVSFSLLGVFSLLSLYLVVSTPLTAPTILRVISGETKNTPPQDYFSRKSMNFFTDLEYRFHESIAGIAMTVLGTDRLVTWLSRGIIASLACAGVVFTIGRNYPWTNAAVLPVLLLVVSRLFARVGDLQIEKSVWSFPTAMVIAAALFLAILALDTALRRYSGFLQSKAGSKAWLSASVAIPMLVAFPVLYLSAGTDNLPAVTGAWLLLVVASLGARNPWRLFWSKEAG